MTETSYFPIKIRIVETNEIKIVEWDDVPTGIAFIVLETNVKEQENEEGK